MESAINVSLEGFQTKEIKSDFLKLEMYFQEYFLGAWVFYSNAMNTLILIKYKKKKTKKKKTTRHLDGIVSYQLLQKPQWEFGYED